MTTDETPTLFASPEAEQPPAETDEWRDCMRLWTDLAKEDGKRGTPYQRNAPTGKAMNARIRQHGADAVRQVLRWYWRSRHDRAVYLRENDHVLTTLMRPDNFVTYLRMSDADADYCRHSPKVVPFNAEARRPRMTDELRRELARRQFQRDGDDDR